MKIAYDCTLKRPGCVLLQAAMGCNPDVANLFTTESWLLEPTPDLKVYNASAEQLAHLIKISRPTTRQP